MMMAAVKLKSVEEVPYAPQPVPPCAADVLLALSLDEIDMTEADLLLSRCHVCARRYQPRGWIDAEMPDGMWRGCAHIDKLRAALAV
jgi:hypothetical protein